GWAGSSRPVGCWWPCTRGRRPGGSTAPWTPPPECPSSLSTWTRRPTGRSRSRSIRPSPDDTSAVPLPPVLLPSPGKRRAKDRTGEGSRVTGDVRLRESHTAGSDRETARPRPPSLLTLFLWLAGLAAAVIVVDVLVGQRMSLLPFLIFLPVFVAGRGTVRQ